MLEVIGMIVLVAVVIFVAVVSVAGTVDQNKRIQEYYDRTPPEDRIKFPKWWE